MGVIRVEKRWPNGQREITEVEGQRALIGSASHCDVRLPMDQAAEEQLLLYMVGPTLRAEVRAASPIVTVNGEALTGSALAPDSVLAIGSFRLFVSFIPDALEAPRLTPQQKQANPLLVGLLLPIFGALAYLLWWDKAPKFTEPPAEAPALFADAPVTCPQQAPPQALAFADEQLEVADGKRERMPFAVEDGVAAVGLYRLAAACYKQADNAGREQDARVAAESLERDLNNDFRARRLRLAHLLAVEDYALAVKDVVVLRALAAARKGRYFDWLAVVTEQLKAKGYQP
jgi:hypothetical protein